MITDSGIRALALITKGLLAFLPEILVIMVLAGMTADQVLLVAAMIAWGIAAYVLQRTGRYGACVVTLVFGLILFASAFAVAYGSIRATGTVIIVAAMAAAGLFLGRRALLLALIVGAAAIAALIGAERAGLIGPPLTYQPGVVHWTAYVAIFSAVGLGSHYVRTRLLEALDESRRSGEQFIKVFQMVPMSLAITRSSDGRVLEVNAADEQHLGYTREEAVGRSMLQTTWIDQDELRRFLGELDARGFVAGFDARHRNKAGEPVDVQVWAARIDLGGEPCIVSAAVNVTERKRDENLILATAAGVAGASGDRLFRALVEHLASTLGCEVAICGELVGDGTLRALWMMKDGSLMPHATLGIKGTPCAALPSSGDLLLTPSSVAMAYPSAAEVIDPRVQGHIGMILRNPEGQPIGVLSAYCYRPLARTPRLEALFRIFAARAEAELRELRRDREIRQLNLRQEERVRERTADLEFFSHSVSHDLCDPLRSIGETSSILLRDSAAVLPADALRRLEGIDDGARKMNALLDGLIEFAELCRDPQSPCDVDMGSLARKLAHNPAGTDGGHVRFEIGDLPHAFGKPRLLAVIWRNLFDNAVKFTRHAEDPCVRVAAQRVGSGVRYSVTDNGAGFDAREAGKLFKVFARLHTKSEFKGAGIGLAMVERIVTRHSGTVEASGLLGAGASFAFTLPGGRGAASYRLNPPASEAAPN